MSRKKILKKVLYVEKQFISLFSYFSQLYHYTYQMCKKRGGHCLPSHTRSHSDSSEKAAFFSATLRRGITRVFFPLAVTLVSDFPAADNPCCQFSSSTSSASKSSKVKFNGRLLQGYLLRGIDNCSGAARLVIQVCQQALDNSFSNKFSLFQLKTIRRGHQRSCPW